MSDAQREKKDSQTVSALASKLQSGWTLLAETCPACHTPLVREKGQTKKMFCVSCNMFCMKEEDVQAEATSKPQQAAKASEAEEVPLAQLEAGLASLSDHAMFGRFTRELRAVNDEGKSVSQASTESLRAEGPVKAPVGRATRRGGAQEIEEEEDDEEAAIAAYASRPNKTQLANQQRLAELDRARTERAARAKQEEEERMKASVVDDSSLTQHAHRVDSLSAKLGAKMLAGWTLLGDTCPNERCGCPLVRARGETVNMLCVNCGAQVQKQGESLVITKQPEARPVEESKQQQQAAAAAAPASQQVKPTIRASQVRSTRRQRYVEEEDSSDEEEDEDEEQLLARLDREEAQRVQALNRARLAAAAGASTSSRSSALPPAAEGHEEEGGEDEVDEDPYRIGDLPADLSDAALRAGPSTRRPPVPAPSPALPSMRGSHLGVPPSAPLSSSGSSNSDAVSAKLGEKMMMGYTLLAAHCPRDSCGCPLVRKKDGPMLCVSCGAHVVPAEEYNAATHGPALSELPAKGETGGRVAVLPPGSTALTGASTATSTPSSSSSPAKRSSGGSSLLSSGRLSGASPTSSGLPSPRMQQQHGHVSFAQVSRSRAQSEAGMDGEEAESTTGGTIDPRLAQLASIRGAQLGGQRGKLGAAGATRPHSRAPSLAFGTGTTAASLGAPHTSSAALNAAAQVAFGRVGSGNGSSGASSSLSQYQQLVNNRSGQSSLEQSPRLHPHNTPPATPNVVPSLALHQHASAAAGSGRFSYESFSGASAQPAAARQSVPLPSFSLNGGSHAMRASSPTPSPMSPRIGGGSVDASALSPSIPSASASAVWSATHATLLSRVEECRRRMSATDDLAQWRELATTMRDLVAAIRCFE